MLFDARFHEMATHRVAGCACGSRVAVYAIGKLSGYGATAASSERLEVLRPVPVPPHLLENAPLQATSDAPPVIKCRRVQRDHSDNPRAGGSSRRSPLGRRQQRSVRLPATTGRSPRYAIGHHWRPITLATRFHCPDRPRSRQIGIEKQISIGAQRVSCLRSEFGPSPAGTGFLRISRTRVQLQT